MDTYRFKVVSFMRMLKQEEVVSGMFGWDTAGEAGCCGVFKWLEADHLLGQVNALEIRLESVLRFHIQAQYDNDFLQGHFFS